MACKRTLLVISVFAVLVPGASAQDTKYAWTSRKAEVMLMTSTQIQLPTTLRETLEPELERQLALFERLALIAQQDRANWLAAETFANYVGRFKEALIKIRSGLTMDTASCVGKGRRLGANRYTRFTCKATSNVLEIPNVEVLPAEPMELPQVVEGPIRREGPFPATFSIHVTGYTKLTFVRTS